MQIGFLTLSNLCSLSLWFALHGNSHEKIIVLGCVSIIVGPIKSISLLLWIPPSLLLNYAPAAFHMGTGTRDSSAWKQAVKQDQKKQKQVIGYADKQGARPHAHR